VGLLRRITGSVSPRDERPTLIVEDNPDEARALAAALEQAGFPVTCAASVGEALARVDANASLLAAIVDMKLPDASGGLVVWQLRRRFGSGVPIAVVTGMHDPHAEFNLSRYPPDRLFPKPLDVDQLLRWVAAVQAGGKGE
jgi:DNA-binding response OmpR family regulator